MEYPSFPGMWDQSSRQVSDVKPKYPFTNATQTKSGHIWLMDDTPGSETIRLQHANGTFFEMHTDGGHTLKVMGNNFTAIVGNDTLTVSGNCMINVKGNVNMVVDGSMNHIVKGDLNQIVEGDYNQKIVGTKTEVLNKDPKMILNGALGAYKFLAQGGLNLTGDLTVSGSIKGASMYAEGSITAGTGIHAGVAGSVNPLAGISTLGGISSGYPQAKPIPGYIESVSIVTAPVINGIMVIDILGSMLDMRLQHNMHMHVGNLGYSTSIPIIPML